MRLTAAEYRALAPKPAKYRNKVTYVDGHRFDSRAEAARYGVLLMQQRAGLIANLEVHPRFRLEVNGELVGHYRADFRYDRDGVQVVEDVKSVKTRRLAGWSRTKRLFRICYGFDITEVLA